MSLKYNLSHLEDYIIWRSACDWRDFEHLILEGSAEFNAESLKITGVAAIFSNDYTTSEEFPTGRRYGKQPDDRQVNVRSYVFDRAADQTEFKDDLEKLKVSEVARTLCGAPSSPGELLNIIDNDNGLSLRDELIIEDFPKGYLLFSQNVTSGEKVVILYHHAFIRSWFFWRHFAAGNLLPTAHF
jgi:hypothetical protein